MSRPPHLLDALRDTVLLCDGGMGSRVQGMTLDVDRDFHGKENCTDVLNLSRPDLVRDIHRGYFEAGADMVETNTFGGSPVTLAEFDIADRAFEINKLRRRTGARGGGAVLRRPPSLGDRQRRARHQAAEPRQHRLRPAGGGADPAMPRPARRRRRCDPDRDLPGHAADQGGGERRQDRARRGRQRHPDLRAGDGGDHRHAAGRSRHRRRRRGGARAGCADDGAELRHRAAGDGRAYPLAGGELARPAVDAAECRPAGTGRWPDALSARPGRSDQLAGTLRRAGRRQPDRRLLRHQHAAHRRAGRDAAPARRGRRACPPGGGGAQVGVDAVGRQPVPGGAAAAGERVLRHRRALQRQRLEEVARGAGEARLGRLRLDGPRADRRRLQRARCLHRVRRARRDRRNERGDPPLHQLGERAAGDRQHRDAGDRRRR